MTSRCNIGQPLYDLRLVSGSAVSGFIRFVLIQHYIQYLIDSLFVKLMKTGNDVYICVGTWLCTLAINTVLVMICRKILIATKYYRDNNPDDIYELSSGK